MRWPQLATAVVWLVDSGRLVPCDADVLTLGYLYLQSGSSWVVESFSQFKLGIQDVNADPEVLPNTTLTYVVRDSEGDETRALAGAMDLIAIEGLVGVVGTGISAALQFPAGVCSVAEIPIVSPGSTLIDLTDKSRFPYLMRSIASDALDLKAMVVTLSDLGWRACAALYHSQWSEGYSQVWQPAFEALAFAFLPLVLRTPDNAIDKARVTEVLELVSTSGYRVGMVYTYGDDLPFFDEATRAAGLRTASYAWMVYAAGLHDELPRIFGGIDSAILSVYPMFETSGNPVSEAYTVRWPSVSTLYNASIHGEFDGSTHEPFFGSSTYEPIIWDTDYAPVGDGLPDFWGKFAYDTVWLYARAIHAVQQRGADPKDGKALRSELLQQNFLGVSGQIQFDQDSQDRSKGLQIVLLQGNATPPYVLANVTSQLSLSSPSEAGWCRSGCTSLGSTGLAGIPWPAGTQPSDGFSLDHDESTFFIASSFREETGIEIAVHVRDSFRNVPCASTCSDGDPGACEACQVDFVDYSALEPRFLDVTSSALVEAPVALQRNVSFASGTATLVLPQGLQGSGTEDRTVIVDILYEGKPVAGSGVKVLLQSTACDAGYRTGDDGACITCSPGSFSDVRGSSNCTQCPTGTFQAEEGKTACQECDAGYFANVTGMRECLRCGKGSFQSEKRQSECISCKEVLPGNTQTSVEGATSPDECMCQEDYYFVRPSLGGSPSCQACLEGLECPGGNGPPLQAERYHAGLPAYADGPPTFVILCANGKNCPSKMALNTCPVYREGLACETCAIGYYANGSGDCQACDASARFVPTLILLFAGLAFTFALYKLATRQLTVTSQNLATMAITGSLVLNAMQSLTAFSELSLEWQEPMQSLNQVLALLTFQLDYLNPGCTFQVNDPVLTYAGSLLIYPAAFMLLMAMFGVGKLRGKPGSWAQVWNAVGIAMMVFYLSLAMASLLPLQCTKNPDGSSSLAAKRSVLCGSEEHTGMVGLAVVAIMVYIVPFFTLVIYLTLTYKRKIAKDGARFVRRTEFLFKRFRIQYYYYGLVFITRNLVVALIPVFFSGQPELQVMAMQFIIIVVLCLSCRWSPWRTRAANAFDVLINIGLTCVLNAGTIFTSFNTDRTMRIVQFFMLGVLIVMFGAALCLFFYNAKHYLWPPKTYAVFLSHHKGSAQVLARWFKIGIQERSAEEIFLDSDNLEELPALLHIVGFETKNLVILLTQQTLSRLWCACEVATAHRHRVNIVLVSCDGTAAPSDEYLSELTEMWTESEKAELTNLGVEVSHIAEAYAALRDAPLLHLSYVPGQGVEETIIRQVMDRCDGFGNFGNMFRGMTSGRYNQSGEDDAKAEVFIAGKLDDPEASCCCQVVKKMLVQQTQLGTSICGEQESDLKDLARGDHMILVAMLSRGVLSCPKFAAAVVTAKNAGHVSILPVVADASFQFPDAAFWHAFSENKVLDQNDPALSGMELHEVEEAYKAMFKVIALKFTEYGSEKIQHAEIEALASRMKSKLHTQNTGRIRLDSLWSEQARPSGVQSDRASDFDQMVKSVRSFRSIRSGRSLRSSQSSRGGDQQPRPTASASAEEPVPAPPRSPARSGCGDDDEADLEADEVASGSQGSNRSGGGFRGDDDGHVEIVTSIGGRVSEVASGSQGSNRSAGGFRGDDDGHVDIVTSIGGRVSEVASDARGSDRTSGGFRGDDDDHVEIVTSPGLRVSEADDWG